MATAGTNRSVTWIWMIGALLVVGVFLVWLGITSEPSVIEGPVVEEASGPLQTAATGTPIQPEMLNSGAAGLVGTQVEVTATVSQALGSSLVLLALPGGGSFLVKSDAASVSMIQPNSAVRIVGTVMDKTDALVSQWEQDGSLDAANAVIAGFGEPYYIEAVELRPAGT